MALIADDYRDRAEQLLVITERLTALIAKETALIKARLPPRDGAEGDEKNRLANAYRLELARIKQEPALIEGARHPAARMLALLLFWAFVFHLFAGVRHLALDMHRGVGLQAARRSGLATVAASVAATFAFAVWLLA